MSKFVYIYSKMKIKILVFYSVKWENKQETQLAYLSN